MGAPEISVVVPVLERYDQLARMLDHLDRQDAPPGAFDVVVACDAAEPNPERTDAAIGERTFVVERIIAPHPGAAWARQVGWQRSGGRIVLFLDSDVLAEPRLVREHLEWHRSEPAPEVAVLGRLRWADELRVTAFMRWIERGVQFDFDAIAGTEAGWGRFYTANASVKRELLERVGGFDPERFPFHYEDLELAYRMDEHGLRLLYNRDACAEHLHAVTLDSYRRRMAEVAPLERRFVAAHPDVPPYFHDRFRRAASRSPARCALAPLVRWVSPETPWIGPRAWRSADHLYEGELAPEFLAAWDDSSAGRRSSDPK